MSDGPEDLRARTKTYASAVVRFYTGLPKGRHEVRVLGDQFLRSGTSVAGQYREASRARSDAEFISKIECCTQEADESDLWLQLLRDDCNISGDDLIWLLKETDELIAIFVTMVRKVKAKRNKS